LHSIKSTLVKTRNVLSREYIYLVVVNIINVYLMIIGWNYYDVNYFIAWYNEYFKTGRILEIYTSELKVAYPPLAIFHFVLTHAVATWLFGENLLAQVVINKIPLLIAFNTIYFILRRHYGRIAGYLWLATFSAYSLILSYQFDLTASLFILLAITSLKYKKYTATGVYLALASLLKQTLGVLALPVVLYLYKKRAIRELKQFLLGVVLTVGVFIAPFFITSPTAFLDKILFFHARRPPQYMSIWAIPLYYYKYELNIIVELVSTVWIIPFLAYLVLTVFNMWWKLETNYNDEYFIIVKYMVLLVAGLVFLNKIGNINYLVWTAPPLIVFTSLLRDQKVKKSIVNLYVFINSIISFVFGFIMFATPLIAGSDYIFVAEDWKWVPADKFIYDCLSSDPSNFVYGFIIFLRSIPAVREAAYSISITHHYTMVFTILIYSIAAFYIVYLVYKYNDNQSPRA